MKAQTTTKSAVVRYSEAFKIQVIRELESGVHADCASARRAYGIGSLSTVTQWYRKYGGTYKRRKFIRIETMENKHELESLKKRVSELEGALADTTIELLLERQFLKFACDEAGIADITAFKKKGVGKVSTQRSLSKAPH